MHEILAFCDTTPMTRRETLPGEMTGTRGQVVASMRSAESRASDTLTRNSLPGRVGTDGA